jgi:two-component system, chemotaxis family, chemotaxis protein CheY
MDMGALRVLVVDDSPIITRKICMMMDQIGYRVVMTAANGKEAILAYKECHPDVVTMDITMPLVDGIEATRIIKRAYPDAIIIMVTSHGQEKMVLDALKAGAKGYVLKPFQPQKVFEVIENACKRVVLQDKLDAKTVQGDEGPVVEESGGSASAEEKQEQAGQTCGQ